MIRFRKRSHEVPALNTASLPDLIFSVLFFFIIVTHMRQDEVKVKYRVPQGKELSDVARKSSVVRIYIGKPVKGGEGYCIQMDGKVVPIPRKFLCSFAPFSRFYRFLATRIHTW